MTPERILQRLRTFLLVLSGFVLVGAVVELLLSEHTEDPIQFVPFVLCGLGLAGLLVALVGPRRKTLVALQGVMVIVILGSALGIYEHLTANLAFELEIRPSSGLGDVLVDALKGASPLLAPGMLAVAAMIALAATYRHPALIKASDPVSVVDNPVAI